MATKSNKPLWWEIALVLIIAFSCIICKSQEPVINILKIIGCFGGWAYISCKPYLINQSIPQAIILWAKVFLSMISIVYLIYLLYIGFFVFFPKILIEALTKYYGELASKYLSSLTLLIILYSIAVISDNMKDSIINRISSKRYKIFFIFEIIARQFFSMPWKTIIYLIYLLITIASQLSELGIIEITDEFLASFVSSNKMAIVILVALDRIASTWKKEKQRFHSYSEELNNN